MMPQHTITTYYFNELNEKAKKRARDEWRINGLDYEWWDFVYEDAERIGLTIDGFDLGCAQSISGGLENVHKTVQAIIEQHGKQCDTYKLAQEYYRRRHIGTPMSLGEFTQLLLKEYRIILQREYDYLLSDKSVDENILANGYEFTESGKFFILS